MIGIEIWGRVTFILCIILYIMSRLSSQFVKHFRLNDAMIKNAQKILGSKTATEAIETALAEVIYQEKMRKFIEQTTGKLKFEGLA